MSKVETVSKELVRKGIEETIETYRVLRECVGRPQRSDSMTGWGKGSKETRWIQSSFIYAAKNSGAIDSGCIVRVMGGPCYWIHTI